MLPTVAEVEKKMNKRIAFMGKYLAGDERVNEMPALTTMHICTKPFHLNLLNQELHSLILMQVLNVTFKCSSGNITELLMRFSCYIKTGQMTKFLRKLVAS